MAELRTFPTPMNAATVCIVTCMLAIALSLQVLQSKLTALR
jgi:hypothetical protein